MVYKRANEKKASFYLRTDHSCIVCILLKVHMKNIEISKYFNMRYLSFKREVRKLYFLSIQKNHV